MDARSKDAYFIREGNVFKIGTDRIEKTIELTDCGCFIMIGYVNKLTGSEYIGESVQKSDEFAITIDGVFYAGSTCGWKLDNVFTTVLKQDELEIVVILKNDVMKVERYYVAYPGTGIIQEWTVYENISGKDIKVTNPTIFVQRLMQNIVPELDFTYMTGGGNFTGSTQLKTVKLQDGFTKDFDSQGPPEMLEIDGHYVNKLHERYNGTAIWFEFFALCNRVKNEGWYLTFDYQGWWQSQFTSRDRNTSLVGWCVLKDYAFPAGSSIKMPPMMSGVYTGDIDDLGNTINEYIYKYKWDYTRDEYFNRINMTIWREAPLSDKVYKMVEAARYIGCERIWVDDFWFDAKGNWNGIFGDDWKLISEFINKNGMKLRLWMPPWHADRLSDIWLEHPEWMLDFHGNWYNWTIDMSIEEAYQWILNMLCSMQRKIGTYDLRVDGDPCNVKNDRSFDTKNGDWNVVFKQSENFYQLYKEFKDKNPKAGLDGCSSGGHTLTIESVRYTDQQQITDGECHHIGGYWTTIIMPIDKHQGMPIAGTKSSWHEYLPQERQLFSAPGYSMQNPEKGYNLEVIENMRKDVELFRWLRKQGIYGRWIKVYRPTLEHGDRTFIMQRMTWDNMKGLIMISNSELNPIIDKSAVIYPKGLLPNEKYTIESLEGSMEITTQTGAKWMKEGIRLFYVKPGESLLINLHGRPGQGTDTEPPTMPSFANKRPAKWFGHEGVEVYWGEASDNVMVSYYEILRNERFLTKVSTGTYYFDDQGCIDDEYKVRAVDIDGNTSVFITVSQ